MKVDIENSALEITERIQNDPKITSDKKRAELIKEVKEKKTKMIEGADNSNEQYRKLEANIGKGGKGYKGTKKARGDKLILRLIFWVDVEVKCYFKPLGLFLKSLLIQP